VKDIIANLLPTVIMIESFLAGIVYLYYEKYGSSIYWFAAGLLNLSVIYLMKLDN
jgi:hypothetical protein